MYNQLHITTNTRCCVFTYALPYCTNEQRPYGALAEYCLCDETELAHKPKDRYISHEQAAAVPLAALTALQVSHI
jgi:NADPH:quinone reductase-like Zn-dependent oxidoreductase